MKLKRFLACLLILSCMSQTSVFSDGLKNNDIHFDTKRLESDSQKNSGFQTELTKDLFKKKTLKNWIKTVNLKSHSRKSSLSNCFNIQIKDNLIGKNVSNNYFLKKVINLNLLQEQKKRLFRLILVI